jgi:predicted transcriptional regulator
MTRKLFEIASDIVQAQASLGQMAPEDVQVALMKTFSTLQKMKKAEEEGLVLEEEQTPEELQPREAEKLSPQDSIQNDKIICLECGAEFRQLTARHLYSHDLTPREYKKKYGFSMRTPLSAKSLTKARSKAAKKRGLPENLVKYREEQRQMKEQAYRETAPADSEFEQGEPEDVSEEMRDTKGSAKRGRKKKTAA